MRKLGTAHMANSQRRYCFMKGFTILLVSICIILFLLGCGSAITYTSNLAKAQNQQNVYSVGETFMLGNLQYKINSVRILDGDTSKVKPLRDDYTFLLVDLTIANHGCIDAEVRSPIGFKLKNKDGQRQSTSLRAAALAVKGAMDGTITAGGKLTGELGYEVLKGTQPFELAIILDPLSTKTSTATVKIPLQ